MMPTWPVTWSRPNQPTPSKRRKWWSLWICWCGHESFCVSNRSHERSLKSVVSKLLKQTNSISPGASVPAVERGPHRCGQVSACACCVHPSQILAHCSRCWMGVQLPQLWRVWIWKLRPLQPHKLKIAETRQYRLSRGKLLRVVILEIGCGGAWNRAAAAQGCTAPVSQHLFILDFFFFVSSLVDCSEITWNQSKVVHGG